MHDIKRELLHVFHRHKAMQDKAGIVISPALHRADLLVVQSKLLLPGTVYDPETFWDDRQGITENSVELTATLKICIACLQEVARNTTQATEDRAVFTFETLSTLMNVNAKGLRDIISKLKVSGFCGVQQTGWRSAFQLTGVLSLPDNEEAGLLRNVIARPLTKKEIEQGNHKGALVLMRCRLNGRIWQQRFIKTVGSLADTTGLSRKLATEERLK